MTPEERVHVGDRAKEVLENEAFAAALQAIEDEVIQAWKTSPARDQAGRENLWIYLHLLQKLRQQLQTTMETGKLATLEIKHQETLLERAKNGLTSWLE